MNRYLSKLIVHLLTFVLLATTALASRAAAQSPAEAPTLPAKPVPGEGPAGEWLGALAVGPVKLRLALHVEKKGDGGLGAILDSIDQGGAKIPVDTVAFEGGTLRLTLKAIDATYEGKLNADGSALEGTWSQGGQHLPLTLHRLEKAFALNRPQEPKGPFPYESREVAFHSEAGNARLVGTLLLPAGKGPFPAVALVTGSGPQDRDETLMGHKPFLVIADALARRGIASLRWDDRGTAASGGDHWGSTVDDFAADARAAVAILRSRPEVDKSAIGIVGHSEGGLIAPMVAASSQSVGFLVLLAPPGEPIRSLLMRQTRDLYRLQGLDPKLIDRTLAAQAEDLDLIADPALTVDRLQEKLRALAEARRPQFTAEERAQLRIDGDAIERAIRVSTTAWFRSLIRKDPAVYLREVKIPVLALFGEKDFQVEPQVNAAAARASLAAAGNPNHEERILPGLNHLFQHAKTGSIEEYAEIEETFAPEALSTIGDWIMARFPKRRSPAVQPANPGAGR
ncbi:MAG TPA: alpha/beta fold hydrolase [Thermoanaerobaculia bacterium]|nr:alpha/beta fold hydrolase [Thermoanaerobaculia bacterium]